MFQIQTQSLRPVTTAHLAQTMTLLSLTAEELLQEIDTQLSSNPALELVEERRCPTCRRLLPEQGSCPVCSSPSGDWGDEPVVFVSPREIISTPRDNSDEGYAGEDFSSKSEDLPTYVLRQIGPDLEPDERRLAAYLLSHLDEDGFLTITLYEIAQYYHVPVSKVEHVRQMVQRADPIGVGSNSPQEALLAQLEVLAETRPVPELAFQVIREGMDLLTHRQYNELARRFKVTLRDIQQVGRFISENLNPFPGRSHWGDVRQPAADGVQVYHHPDIIISHLNEDDKNPLLVEIILPVCGTLRVNPLFRQAIQQAASDKKEEWKSDLEKASLFVKCLQQRNHTMQRLLHLLVMYQKEFILRGEKSLKPLTRARLSDQLEVHESTISRAVANKTVQLPNRRIIPLSSFFDRSLNVRTILRDLIAEERRPLKDSELAELLSEQGFNVARRTVAKYRAMEGILPAHMRHSISSSV